VTVKQVGSDWFGEEIRMIGIGGDLEDFDLIILDGLADVVGLVRLWRTGLWTRSMVPWLTQLRPGSDPRVRATPHELFYGKPPDMSSCW
jgi:hypothetical protein